MKYVRENINEKFAEKSDPVEDMGIGIEAKFKSLQNTQRYLKPEDFDDELILYLFKPAYDKWQKLMGSVNPDDITIWEDSNRIKILAPDVRETTLIIGEHHIYTSIKKDIVNYLRSSEIKNKIAVYLNDNSQKSQKLTQLIYTSAGRKKLNIGGMYVAHQIGERLIEILK